MDLRSGLAGAWMAEGGLLAAACIDIGRYYELPTSSDSLTTDSPVPDANAAADKFSAGYLAALAGANMNAGTGGLSSVSTASLEKLVIDDDIYGRIFRQVWGIDVDEESLAYEVIARVGPANSFVADPHTHEHSRQEYSYSRSANHLPAMAWEAAGSKDVVARASDRVREILRASGEPLLEGATVKELRRIAARAQEGLKGTAAKGEV